MSNQGASSPKFFIFVIGLIIGLLIAGGFALFRSALSNRGEKDQSVTETQGIVLSISSPSDGEVVNEGKIDVKGNSGKDTVVVITGGKNDDIIETSQGNFSASIDLFDGENEISIYAFDTNTGESAQDNLEILYLSGDLASTNFRVAASHTPATEKAKENINKIKEKLATASSSTKSKPVSVDKFHIFGTIISLNKGGFTLKSKKGNTKTVFYDDLTKFFSIGQKEKGKISFEDLKVGDEVSIIGLSEDDSSGLAKIVVKRSKPAVSRHAIFGKVSDVSKDTVTLTHIVHSDRLFIIKINSGTKVKIKGSDESDLSDIKKGDVVIAVGTLDNNGDLTATKLFVVPGKFEGVKPKESTSSATPSSSP